MSSQVPTAFQALLARRGLPVLLLALATFVGYSGTLGFGFVYDDVSQIVLNPAIHEWSYLPQYFSEHTWAAIYSGSPGNQYRPLFLLWLRINYALFGLQPSGWHLVSVLCHIGVTLLVYRLVLRMLQDREAALVAALLFGIHPVNIEAVAWISAVSELLMTACVLGALLILMRARAAPVRWGWLLAVALYAAAMLFKETGIVFIALAGAFYLLQPAEAPSGEPANGHQARNLLALALAAAGYLAVRWQVLHGIGQSVSSASWGRMAITWPAALLFYAKHLLFPFPLSGSYDFGYVSGATWGRFWWPCLALLTGSAVALWAFQGAQRKKAIFGLVLLLVPLSPVLYLRAFREGDLVHDRYLYLPCVGFVLLLALLYQKLRGAKSGSLRPRLAWAGAGALAVLFGAALVTQQVYWANDLVFYARGVETAPDNLVVMNNLGVEFLKRGDTQRATALFQRVLTRDPHQWIANFNLGYLAYTQGRYSDAEPYFRAAVEALPGDPGSHMFLGLTEFRLQHLEAAQAQLERALALRPNLYGFHEALAQVLAARGNSAAARREFQAELALHPDNLRARKALENLDRP
jgi:tetratricopeptide (TPR) repeat protein